MEEHAALNVLHRWGEMKEFLPVALPLVPEHVEIRSLMNQDKPGLPQVINTYHRKCHKSNEKKLELTLNISGVHVRVAGLPLYVGGHVSH